MQFIVYYSYNIYFARDFPFYTLPATILATWLSGFNDLAAGNPLKSQRRRIVALADEAGKLRKRGKCLLAESYSLAESIARSRANLPSTFHETIAAVATVQLRGSGRESGIARNSKKESERVLTDSPDMVEALRQAAEILEMEFLDAEGSGREPLAKCEKVLQRARTVRTIELPPY